MKIELKDGESYCDRGYGDVVGPIVGRFANTISVGDHWHITTDDGARVVGGSTNTIRVGGHSVVVAEDRNLLFGGYQTLLIGTGDDNVFSGEEGCVFIAHWEDCEGKRHVIRATVGEAGIYDNTEYRLSVRRHSAFWEVAL